MSEKHSFYQGFINVLQQKIPQKASLVNTIADLPVIDKDAVYRRLRGEVNFSFIEMASIAIKLGMSLAITDRYVTRKATLISVSGEKVRTAFFNTQRKILNTH